MPATVPEPPTGSLEATQPEEGARLRQEVEDLRARLADSEETLRAIRHGEVDALVVGPVAGEEQLFTLSSVDRPYRNFVEGMSDGAATLSVEGIVLYANQALADIVSASCQRIVGAPFLDWVTEPGRAALEEAMLAAGPGRSVEALLLKEPDATVPVLLGVSTLKVPGDQITCITVTDLTSEREAEAALAHAAHHDALTGLPNRALLTDRIQHALDRRAGDAAGQLALLFCDVDGFKSVNDAHGHQVGDVVLRGVAQRIAAAVRPEDTVARIGGDEFVVLCDTVADPDDAAMVAARVRLAVAAPVKTDVGDVDVTLSIGVAVAKLGEHADPDTLLRDSDEAMYKAKRQGPNVIEVFDDELRVKAASRLTLLTELRRATSAHELCLEYQPIVRIDDESLVGVEALVRWKHPLRGRVLPGEFIPFAERSGLILTIGSWVLREACLQAAAWAVDSDGPISMSVNVSGRQLAPAAGLVDSVKLALDGSELDPAALVLEVTESALLDDAEAALRVVNELKELGVRIAIDDFGTGYSSMLYLKRFPVDLLKVDRSFVAGLGLHRADTAIVRSVIELAHAFDLAAVAEGIETPEQLGALEEMGCHYGQGFLWQPSRPAAQLAPELSFGSSLRHHGGSLRRTGARSAMADQ